MNRNLELKLRVLVNHCRTTHFSIGVSVVVCLAEHLLTSICTSAYLSAAHERELRWYKLPVARGPTLLRLL